jgi:hypothetical protein
VILQNSIRLFRQFFGLLCVRDRGKREHHK